MLSVLHKGDIIAPDNGENHSLKVLEIYVTLNEHIQPTTYVDCSKMDRFGKKPISETIYSYELPELLLHYHTCPSPEAVKRYVEDLMDALDKIREDFSAVRVGQSYLLHRYLSSPLDDGAVHIFNNTERPGYYTARYIDLKNLEPYGETMYLPVAELGSSYNLLTLERAYTLALEITRLQLTIEKHFQEFANGEEV